MRILHLLNWPLKNVEYVLDKVSSQKFNAIQINPIQPLKEDGYREWWMSYQPCDFSIGNIYGNREDLINLCESAKKYNLNIIADVICNHVAESNDENLVPHAKVAKRLRDNSDFFKERININDWQSRYQVINYCMNLPGLKTSNHCLQDIIIEFLNDLIDCGVMGFRFDAAKSIALPSEGNDFFERVIYCLKKYGLFIYGEVLFADCTLIDKYSKYINVLTNYDGTDKNHLVKYVENHDTYLSSGDLGYTKNIPSDEIARQYYELTKMYNNTLFYARPYDDTWQTDKIRHANEKIIK